MSKNKQNLTTKDRTPIPYFSITKDNEAGTADIYIFGNIAQNRGGLSGLLQANSDQSSYDLANQITSIPEGYDITVHINSNGGELKEGLGIYNVLKTRNVTTICEGFAASAGSVIFCAGKTRIMQPASLLFIHQASMTAEGNADDFEKASADLRIVTSAAVEAYKESGIVIDDDKLSDMLKAETWITPEEAVSMGFATQIAEPDEEGNGAIMNDAMRSIMAAVKRAEEESVELVTVTHSIIDTMKAFTDTSREYCDLFALAGKAVKAINDDPELLVKLKAVAETILATNTAPKSPAGVEHKGFFNL